MKTNIPIYRAKKIDSDEYVEGYYMHQNMDTQIVLTRYGERPEQFRCNYNLIVSECGQNTNIDPSTLSISFPDMLDKNNKRIFASLSEDGKGGDKDSEFRVFMFRKYELELRYFVNNKLGARWNSPLKNIEVIGIYEGDSNE